MEDRSRRNNIRVEGVPVSENERWDVTEEKLRKVIKDKLDNENVVTEQTQRVKQNNDNNENNEQTGQPPTVVAKLLYFKEKQDTLHKAKSRKTRKNFFKEYFSRETLAITKGLWNEVIRLREEEGNFVVINYGRIYSRSFRSKNNELLVLFVLKRIENEYQRL